MNLTYFCFYFIHSLQPTPYGSFILSVLKHAIGRKCGSGEKRDHWLDHADDKYSKKKLNDVKVLLKVLKLYLPIPIFWALFDQQGSKWTLQATRMDGSI